MPTTKPSQARGGLERAVQLHGGPYGVQGGRTGAASSRASAVGSMPVGVRWNRSSWNVARSRRSALLAADWVSPSLTAARVTWRSS